MYCVHGTSLLFLHFWKSRPWKIRKCLSYLFLGSDRLKGKTANALLCLRIRLVLFLGRIWKKATSRKNRTQKSTQSDKISLITLMELRESRFSRRVSASSETRFSVWAPLLWGVIIIEIKALMMTIDDGIHTLWQSVDSYSSESTGMIIRQHPDVHAFKVSAPKSHRRKTLLLERRA
jgi:hypothetical protein